MSYTIVPARVHHAALLHGQLSKADREELAVTQSIPLEAICRGIKDSEYPVAVLDKHGDIAAIAGVVPIIDGGAPWMLSTDAAKTEPLAFVRQAQEWVCKELGYWTTLKHHVYRHNHSHIRLLKLLGFKVEEPRHSSQLFLPFSRSCVPQSP